MDWRDNLIQVKDSRFCPPSNNSFSPTNLLASCLLSISKYLQDYQELLRIRLKIARYRKLLQREEHWLGIVKDVQISWIHPKQQQHCTTEWRDDLTQVKDSRFYPCQIFFSPPIYWLLARFPSFFFFLILLLSSFPLSPLQLSQSSLFWSFFSFHPFRHLWSCTSSPPSLPKPFTNVFFFFSPTITPFHCWWFQTQQPHHKIL